MRVHNIDWILLIICRSSIKKYAYIFWKFNSKSIDRTCVFIYIYSRIKKTYNQLNYCVVYDNLELQFSFFSSFILKLLLSNNNKGQHNRVKESQINALETNGLLG